MNTLRLFIKQLLFIAAITFCMPTLCMMNTLREYADKFKLGLYRTFFEKPSVYNTGTQAIDTTASNLSTAAVRLSPYMFPFRNLTPEQKKFDYKCNNR